MLWHTGFDETKETYQHIAKLARIRRASLAIRRGDTKVIWSSDHTQGEEDAGIFAFERAGGDAPQGYALVVLNTNGRKASRTAEAGRAMKTSRPNTTFVDVLDPRRATYATGPDGALSLDLPEQSAKVLVPQDEAP